MAIKIAGNRVLDYDVLSYSNTNIAVGYQTLQSLTTGTNNSAVGNSALYDLTTATNNTVIGYNTGRGLTTGSKNTIIGANVTGLSATLANTIILADGDGNKRIYVDSSGNVGIGTTNPGTLLEVFGSITSRVAATQDSVILAGRAGGTSSYGVTLTPTTLSASRTLTLPDTTGTIVTTGDSGTVTSTMIADSTIVNGDISASAAIAVSKLAASTISGVTLGNNLNTLTLNVSGTGLSGSTTYNGSAAATFTVTSNATSANTASTIVARDASGNFSAGTITATTLAGTLSTAAQTNITSLGTLSSLTISGNLTVDTNTLFVDSTNDRVGIGTLSPGRLLDVRGLSAFSDATQGLILGPYTSGSGYGAIYNFGTTPSASNYVFASSTSETVLNNGTRLVFAIGASEKARIDSSGNVGIGTASNAGNTLRYFDVQNTDTGISAGAIIRLITSNSAGTGSNAVDIVRYKTGLFIINNNDSSGIIAIYNAGSERMRIDSTGNVGIGTSPLTNFHVNGSAVGPSGEVGNLLITAGTTAKRLALGVDSSGTMYSWIQSVENGVVQRALSLQPIGGNVGIGTTSPTATLHVNASATTASSLTWGATAGQILRNEASELAIGLLNASPYPLWIQGRTNSNTARDIVLQPSGGNIGIGTTNPQAGKLNVYGKTLIGAYDSGAAIAGGQLELRSAGATESRLDIWQAGVALGSLGSPASSSVFYIVNNYSGTGLIPGNGIAISTTGNVGIGTASPGKKLDIISGSEVGLRIAASTTSGYAYIQLGQSATAANNWHFGSENDGSLRFYSGNWGAGTFRAYLNNLNNGTFHINDVAIGRGGGANLGNVAVGYLALNTNNAAAGANTAVGSYAMQYNTTGFDNTAVGYLAFRNNTISNYSTAIGAYALENNTTGDNNTAVGSSALRANTTGFQNAALGTLALRNNTTGWGNTAVGWYALINNTTGYANTALGRYALQANTVGSNNTAIGLNAMLYTTTGAENVAVGTGSLQTNTTGGYNVAVGYAALNASTTANHNTALGYLAGLNTTSGYDNCAFGSQCFQNNTTGYGNIAIGRVTLISNTTGFQNTAVGYLSMYYSTTGYNNCALGVYALHKNTTGNDNTALGSASLQENTTGYRNSAVGMYALVNNTTGYNNNAVGYETLRDATTGFQNTAIGHNTGRGITTGSKNTIIGANVTGLSATLSNNIIIADGDGNQRIKVDSTPNIEMISKLYLTSNGNLKIGGSTNRGTQGTNNLNILDGTAPSGTLYTGITIYSSSGECYVMDSNGNATQISPHDRQTNEWIFNSTDTRTGKTLRIDVERLLRFVNDHFGLDCVHDFMVESR